MESLIPAHKQAEESAFIKRHLDALASQKKKLPDDYVPPERKRAKRASIANISVVAPPEPSSRVAARTAATGDGDVTQTMMTLSIKSTKPALAYTLDCSPTASILSLKEQLRTTHGPGAPPADAQRWVLNGKAMADNKLLNEYSVGENDKVFLMIQKGWTPIEAPPLKAPMAALPVPSPSSLPPPESDTTRSISPTVSRGHIRVPSLTLERAESSESLSKSKGTSPTITPLDTSTPNAPHPAPIGVSQAFLDAVTHPSLWTDVNTMLKTRFQDDEAARKVFEAWFGATKVWLTPSQISRIRDETGIRGMAGL